jgi:hypothetical protein
MSLTVREASANVTLGLVVLVLGASLSEINAASVLLRREFVFADQPAEQIMAPNAIKRDPVGR